MFDEVDVGTDEVCNEGWVDGSGGCVGGGNSDPGAEVACVPDEIPWVVLLSLELSAAAAASCFRLSSASLRCCSSCSMRDRRIASISIS